MDSTQKIIDEMKSGNRERIEESINSDSPILILNAIVFGMKYKLSTQLFVEGLENALENEKVLMGYRINQLAKAAWHLLNGIFYEGGDEKVKQFIACELKLF